MDSPSTNLTLPIKILLILTLLIGGGLRLYNLNWDQGTYPHPDERSTLLFYAPTIGFPDDWGDTFDPRKSPLNPFWNIQEDRPRSYTYGHFPLYLLVGTGHLFTKLAPTLEALNLPPDLVTFFREATTGFGYTMLGRGITALFDTLSIYLVFLIAWRLYGAWAGLLAAALSAFTVFHIQLAHFFAVDPISATFVLLTIYGALLMFQRRTPEAAILTGVAIGLAVSSKYSSLPVVLSPAIAAWFIWHKPALAQPEGQTTAETPPSAGGFTTAFYLLSIAALVSFMTFAVTSPFVLLDYENYDRAVVEEQGNMVSGIGDWPFTRQYRNTTPYLYFIEQQVRWGMGWPLGLLAFIGLGWAVVQLFRGKLPVGGWIILAWLIPYFGLTGLFLAKFMRYMSPVTPLVIIFGVGLLVALGRRFSPWLAGGVAGIVLITAVFWSFAFMNGVYASEHSWVTASRWIYENVPDGSCIAVEHWEEGVPRAWDEPGMSPGNHGYRQPQMPMYDPDTEQKFFTIRDTLRGCDYLVIASNRMYRTLPRLKDRYPMSTVYYDKLFGGELGYKLVKQVATPPQLGGFIIDDLAADESFTVYDHPKAFIFEKTRELSDGEWFNLLGNTWQDAKHNDIGQPTLLMLLRGYEENAPIPIDDEAAKSTAVSTPLSDWPVVDDWQWNDWANASPTAAIFVWWLAIQVIGLITFPLTFLLLSRFADGGYLLSKSLGLLLLSYGVWLLASLGFPANRWGVIMGMLALLMVVNGWLAWSRRAHLVTFLRDHWRLILIGEILFAVVFLIFVNFRLANPDLWHPWNGGEKMLEIGFLNAVVRSPYMPPYDPFFAGTYINYYYYGLFIVGILIKFTGITPTIAFNLAVPLLAAFTAGNTFSLAASLSGLARKPTLWRRVGVGLLAVLIIIFFSNLDGSGQLLRDLGEVSDTEFESVIPGLQTLVHGLDGLSAALEGAPVREYNYWDPSRVIPNTINEFPYWSFLFADLHPHMIGIPFTILFLCLLYAWLLLDHDRRQTLIASFNVAAPETPTILSQTDLTAGQLDSIELDDEGKPSEPEEPDGLDEPDKPDKPDQPIEPALGPGTFAMDVTPFPAEDTPAEIERQPDLAPTPSLTEEIRAVAQAEWADLRAWFSLGLLARWFAFPFVLGALAIINTWDLPTYLGLLAAGFAITRYRAWPGNFSTPRALVLLLEVGLFTGFSLAAVMLLYRPFFSHYQALDVGLGFIKDKIPLDQFLKLWGFFFLVLFTWLWVEFRRPKTTFAPLRALSIFVRRWNVFPHLLEIYNRLVTEAEPGYKNALLWFGIGLAVSFVLAMMGFYTIALLMPWLFIAFLLLLRRETPPAQIFIELLVFTSILLLLGVQFVFLEDFLGGGDYYRMNTYFKFFIQVWILFGIAVAVMTPRLFNRSMHWTWRRQAIWQTLLGILIFASLVYLILGTRTRLNNRFPNAQPPENTLDGMAYMQVGQFSWNNINYELSYEKEAIDWLIENVPGTPIIAEAKLGYYREWGMRVSAYTGLPSILGGLHQSEQHFPAELGQRDGLVNQFWFATDPVQTKVFIDQLGIQYIYIGQLEKTIYSPEQLTKFDQMTAQGMLDVVFENSRVKIYKVAG